MHRPAIATSCSRRSTSVAPGRTWPRLRPASTCQRLAASLERDTGDNVATLTVRQAGRDLTARVDAERSQAVRRGRRGPVRGSPLDRPESAHVSDALQELNLSYSGLFPNNQAAADVLRLQCLRNATAWSHDVAVASPHGAALLEYVIADMESVGQRVERIEAPPGEGPPDETIPLVALR